MRTINKKIKFNWGNGQKMLHESYSNYQEFLSTIMERQPKAHRTIQGVFDDHDRSWMGVNSVQEAKDLLTKGWDKPLEDFKKQVDKEILKSDRQAVRKVYPSVVGFVPVVPNALMRLPNSMLNVRYEKVGSKILRFLIMIDRAGYNDTQTIIRKMSKLLAQIAVIERTGKYRCRLEVCFTAFGDTYQANITHVSCSVLVKSENQLLDVKRLCFPIVHPGMLRLLMFAWIESLPMDYYSYYVSGYGSSFEHWGQQAKDDFTNAINENNEKVIVCDLRSNFDEMFKNY